MEDREVLEPEVLAAWEMCKQRPLKEVAEAMGLSRQKLVALFSQEGLLGNGRKDPSPAEIAERAAWVRSRWDAETERSRWIASRRHDGGVL